MENTLNISFLIPFLPMATGLFIFVLLANFNRTINRLTKPISSIIALSLLGSGFISFYFYSKKIEGDLVLSNFFKILKDTNLVIHIDSLVEKYLIFFSITAVLTIGLLFYKLPRKPGYVSLMIAISLISSLLMFSVMIIDLSTLIN